MTSSAVIRMIGGTVRPSAFTGFETDDEFELHGLLHRKLGGLLTDRSQTSAMAQCILLIMPCILERLPQL
jgi:hypothetical protein